jgi:hypothetical protein
MISDKPSPQHECKLPETPEASTKFVCAECGAEWEWSSDCVYGFPCVENPHDFSPDRESCTPEEIAFWEDAKKRWDAGERDVRGARCETVRNETGEMIAHFTRTSWGIGANSWQGWEQVTLPEEVTEDL